MHDRPCPNTPPPGCARGTPRRSSRGAPYRGSITVAEAPITDRQGTSFERVLDHLMQRSNASARVGPTALGGGFGTSSAVASVLGPTWRCVIAGTTQYAANIQRGVPRAIPRAQYRTDCALSLLIWRRQMIIGLVGGVTAELDSAWTATRCGPWPAVTLAGRGRGRPSRRQRWRKISWRIALDRVRQLGIVPAALKNYAIRALGGSGPFR